MQFVDLIYNKKIVAFMHSLHTVYIRGIDWTANKFFYFECSLYISAFAKEELEAYRHEVRVYLGQKAYKKAKTLQICKDLLAKRDVDEEGRPPFLQVLWACPLKKKGNKNNKNKLIRIQLIYMPDAIYSDMVSFFTLYIFIYIYMHE